ncbi:MAG: universal stress protein [Oceanospirillaceae bacterium]|nr:universal stress protein [Oceanospirillaceae bacterium]
MKKILYIVGIDGSEWSARAAQRAVTIAKDTGASVKFVTVMTFQPSYQSGMMTYGYSMPEFDIKEQERQTLENDVTPLIKKYSDEVELSSELIWGDPVEVLLEQAKSHHANMLFMGRRGRSRLTDLLLGSTANKVAHCAGIPIVLVP